MFPLLLLWTTLFRCCSISVSSAFVAPPKTRPRADVTSHRGTNHAPHRFSTRRSTMLTMGEAETQHTSVGFIGCGTIAAAIATGLATQDSVKVKSIAVSQRSKPKSSALQKAFPDLVTVHDDNQEIIDKSDIIFVCVLPQQTSEVLWSLQFDTSRHTLVSLVVSDCVIIFCFRDYIQAWTLKNMCVIYSFFSATLSLSVKSTSKLDSLSEESGLDQDRVYKMICKCRVRN